MLSDHDHSRFLYTNQVGEYPFLPKKNDNKKLEQHCVAGSAQQQVPFQFLLTQQLFCHGLFFVSEL